MHWTEIYSRLQRDRNDQAAWDALERRVRSLARRELGDYGHHHVDDAVADTCSSAVMAFERAGGPETFAGFVFGFFLNVRNRMLKDLRTSRLVLPLGDVDVPAPEPDERDTPTQGQRQLLRRALAALPERERRAVILRYYEELPAAQIARALGVTEGNARRIVFNGVARLRERLRGACEAPSATGPSAPSGEWSGQVPAAAA